MSMTAALDCAAVPVLLLTGWQDVFLDQTLEQFGHLRRRGVDVAMTVGPWTHDGMATRGTAVTATETLSWLDRHLAADPEPPRRQPLLDPRHRKRRRLDRSRRVAAKAHRRAGFLSAAGPGLGDKRPAADAEPSTFRYDPTDPTPTVGGRLLSRQAGYRDDSTLARRPRRAELHQRTARGGDGGLRQTGRRTGLPLRQPALRRLRPDQRGGGERGIPQRQRRLPPVQGSSGPALRLELDPIAHRFAAGSRIRC